MKNKLAWFALVVLIGIRFTFPEFVVEYNKAEINAINASNNFVEKVETDFKKPLLKTLLIPVLPLSGFEKSDELFKVGSYTPYEQSRFTSNSTFPDQNNAAYTRTN